MPPINEHPLVAAARAGTPAQSLTTIEGYVGAVDDKKREIFLDHHLRIRLRVTEDAIVSVKDADNPARPSLVTIRTDSDIEVDAQSLAEALVVLIKKKDDDGPTGPDGLSCAVHEVLDLMGCAAEYVASTKPPTEAQLDFELCKNNARRRRMRCEGGFGSGVFVSG